MLVGIVNVTPDSFSDGGHFFDQNKAIEHARSMIAAGAAIVDIGGESSRPGAEPVPAEEEQRRIMPVIHAIARDSDAIISVDTWRPETARMAIEAGAHIINDIWGLQRDHELISVARETGAGLIAMHTGRQREKEPDVVQDQIKYFDKTLQLIEKYGVTHDQVLLDPGFGFAKDTDENLRLLQRFEELHRFGFPLMAGTSRKRFIGAVTGRDPLERDIGTAATSVVARMKGAAFFRVHDIPSNKDALAMADAIRMAGETESQLN